MAEFYPNLPVNAGQGGPNALAEVTHTLQELGVEPGDDGCGGLWAEYTPGSYDPILLRFFFLADTGILAVEGELCPVGGGADFEELRIAINYLNVETPVFRFYVGAIEQERLVFVRQDLVPDLEQTPAIHPRELRQAISGLCAQKAYLEDTLQQIQLGRSWEAVKEALRALR